MSLACWTSCEYFNSRLLNSSLVVQFLFVELKTKSFVCFPEKNYEGGHSLYVRSIVYMEPLFSCIQVYILYSWYLIKLTKKMDIVIFFTKQDVSYFKNLSHLEHNPLHAYLGVSTPEFSGTYSHVHEYWHSALDNICFSVNSKELDRIRDKSLFFEPRSNVRYNCPTDLTCVLYTFHLLPRKCNKNLLLSSLPFRGLFQGCAVWVVWVTTAHKAM